MRLGASSRSTVARSWARARSKTTRLGAGEHLGNRLRIRARRLLARVPNVEERVAAVQRQALCKVVLTRGSRRVVPPCIARFVVTPAAIFFQTPARSGQYDMRSMTPDAPTCPATSISTVPESSRGVTAAIVPPPNSERPTGPERTRNGSESTHWRRTADPSPALAGHTRVSWRRKLPWRRAVRASPVPTKALRRPSIWRAAVAATVPNPGSAPPGADGFRTLGGRSGGARAGGSGIGLLAPPGCGPWGCRLT